MAWLSELRIRHLRALEELDLAPEPRANLISGHNGAGKTTLLEAIYLLSRGRSFRGNDARQLIRHGRKQTLVSAEVNLQESRHRIGLTIEGRSARSRLDGSDGARRPEIARIMPVLNLDAKLMDLVDRGPERRRLLLNWVTFHVEPAFNAAWRRFRRALRQRNAGLKDGARAAVLTAWDREFCRAAEEVERLRQIAVEQLRPRFSAMAERLAGMAVEWDYFPGWPGDDPLDDVLKAGLEGDRKQGSTRFGPQRADLILRIESRRARYIASRGQQKLLASALMLASAEVAEQAGAERPVLLADEPLVELDRKRGRELLRALAKKRAQLFIAAVDAGPYNEWMEAREIGLKDGALV